MLTGWDMSLQALIVYGLWFAVPFLLLMASPGYRSFVAAVVLTMLSLFAIMLMGMAELNLGFGAITTAGPSVSLIGAIVGATLWIIRAGRREEEPGAEAVVGSVTCYSGALSALAFLAWPVWTTF